MVSLAIDNYHSCFSFQILPAYVIFILFPGGGRGCDDKLSSEGKWLDLKGLWLGLTADNLSKTPCKWVFYSSPIWLPLNDAMWHREGDQVQGWAGEAWTSTPTKVTTIEIEIESEMKKGGKQKERIATPPPSPCFLAPDSKLQNCTAEKKNQRKHTY